MLQRSALRVFAILGLLIPAGAGAVPVELISKADPVPSSTGLGSGNNALSADGRWVAFGSDAPNLAPGQIDRNGFDDIFLHDRITGTTTLITHAAGLPNTASSQRGFFRTFDVHISADGRFVAFSGTMSNVVPGATDGNQDTDVFLYDRVADTLTLVSHAVGNPKAAADGASFGVRMSTDGNWIAFSSEADNLMAGASTFTRNVYLWHRLSDSLTLVSHESGLPAAGGNGTSNTAGISSDGGFVVFTSTAANLVPGLADNSGLDDVFVYQRSSGTVSLVSRASGSPTVTANGISNDAHISADGRWIAFTSTASNLVAGQIDTFPLDAFLFDRVSGEMRLASRTANSPVFAGGISNLFDGLKLSADGRSVVFASKATNLVPGQVDINSAEDLFLYDRVAGTTSLVSHVRGLRTTATVDPVPSRMPSLSADGRFIAFTSQAQDLVSGQTGVRYIGGVFLHDRSLDTTVLVSHRHDSPTATPNNATGFPAISADGKVVVFKGPATDILEGLVNPDFIQNLFLYDWTSGEVTHISRSDPGSPVATPNGPSTAAAVSRDGNTVLFLSRANGLVPGQVDETSGTGDRFGTWDVFLRDRTAGKTFLLSRSSASKVTTVGGQEPVLSADGRFAAFVTIEHVADPVPYGVWRLFLYDRITDALTLVNRAPGSASTPEGSTFNPSLSADGRYLAFACQSCGLIPGRPQGESEIFVYDRVTGTHTLVTPAAGGDGLSLDVKISANGRFVGFRSYASNLIPGQTDSSETSDLFLFDRITGELRLVSHAAGSATAATGGVHSFGMSGDGRFLAFLSGSDRLVPGQIDSRDLLDVFLHDRVAGTNVLVSHAASLPVTAANGESFSSFENVAISENGRFIAFASFATDLVAGVNDTNGTSDVFLYDRIANTTVLLSTASGSPATAASRGADRPAMSADGSRVAFLSASTDLLPAGGVGVPPEEPFEIPVHLIVFDRSSGRRILVGPVRPVSPIFPNPPISLEPRLSGNGRFVAFTSDSDRLVRGDFNTNWDIFLADAGLPGGAIPLPACKLLDTRRRADRPVLTSDVQRTVTVRGACGVPATARQVLVNVTVINPSGKGNLRFYPGAVTATPSGILRFERNATRTETFTLPLGSNGTLAILPFVAGKGTVHVAMEITGYAN